MLGQTFEKLTVLEQAPSNARGDSRWVCRCDCGNEVTYLGGSLRSGRAKSCGCGRVRLSRDPERIAQRFWDQVEKTEACWNWTGRLVGAGYGHFYDPAGVGPETVMAHRWVYTSLVGEIPADKEIDHLCKNKKCVRPDHLEAVSHSENMKRIGRKKTHCVRGHDIAVLGRTGRACTACRREDARAYQARKRLASLEEGGAY